MTVLTSPWIIQRRPHLAHLKRLGRCWPRQISETLHLEQVAMFIVPFGGDGVTHVTVHFPIYHVVMRTVLRDFDPFVVVQDPVKSAPGTSEMVESV